MSDEFTLEEIEAAYMQAMETADAAEEFFPNNAVNSETDIDSTDRETQDHSLGNVAEYDPLPMSYGTSPNEFHSEGNVEADETIQTGEDEPRLTPQHVMEGLLFVGGRPLPAKKIIDIVGGSLTAEQVDNSLDQLNERYASENRPYEVCLVEGGYQLTLRSEFEAVRRRVYGQGPKEVKLAQDALEVLAFVAYQQPVTKEQVVNTEKKNATGLLRQLVRRQLVKLERHNDTDKDGYITTNRFLELFGISEIDDLPLSIDFDLK